MTKKYFICIVYLFFTLFGVKIVKGQSNPATIFTVHGTVVDKATKEILIGVSVVLLDKDGRVVSGISTNMEGNYSLQVKSPSLHISVSYLGYKTTAPILVTESKVINFQLESTAKTMKDVVVSAKRSFNNGALNIDPRDQTTAVTTIQAKDLEELQAASIDQALQGRMPGVDIISASGDPGAPMQIRIRGTSTLSGNSNPLIIVDGSPYDITIPAGFNFATSDENSYGQLLNIAPSDIKEISVLRDGASTAIWGSKAANGVLVITTKRGTIGKPSLTYTFTGTMGKQPAAVPRLNGDQYSTLILQEYYNASKPFAADPNAKEFQYDPNDPANYYNYSNNTDFISAITQTSYTTNHNLSLTGGGQKARYFTSVGYRDNGGTTVGTDLKNITALVNLDYNVSNKIVFSTGVQYAHVNYKNLYSSKIRSIAYTKMPNQSIYQYDLYGNLTSNYFSPVTTAQGSYPGTYNPLALAEAGVNNQVGDRLTPKFKLLYRILPVLTLTGNIQFDVNNTKVNSFLPQIATGQPYTNLIVNDASDFDNDQFNLATNINLSYTPHIGERNTLTTALIVRSEDNYNSQQQTTTTNTASSLLQDPSVASRTNSAGSANYGQSENRLISLVGTAQYSLLDRYLINVLFNAEGNSKMGPNHRYSIYPTVSGRWRVSAEPFMKKATVFNDLSLRLSRSQVGRAPGSNYGYYNNYQSYGNSYIGETGIYASNLELTNLTWEKSTETNVGLDANMFGNTVQFSIDAYNKTTTDLYNASLQLASYNGYTSEGLNNGSIDNQGIEVTLQLRPVRTRNWTVDFQLNVSKNQNIIRSLSPLAPQDNGANLLVNGTYKTYTIINSPFGGFYGYKFNGVYPDKASTIARDINGNQVIDPSGQPIYMRFGYPQIDYTFQQGDAKYEDVNNDGVIDSKDIVYLGNGNPKLIGGFGPTVTYKGSLKLSAFFTFRYGLQIINGTKMLTTNEYGFDNQSTSVLRRWAAPGDITDIPRALYQSGYNWLGSSRYVEDGSFLRLRSVTARYTFDKQFVQKIRLNNVSAYLTVENLITWTKYSGQDPEVPITNGLVIDNSSTPPIKQVTLGLVVNF